VQRAEEKRIPTPKHILANFARHRFAGLCALKVEQRAKQRELAKTQMV
jgi:hypothetical protein